MKRITKLPSNPTSCPYCGAVHNALSGDAMPSTGDISICFECVHPSVIEMRPGELALRKPRTDEELADCQAAIREVVGGHGRA